MNLPITRRLALAGALAAASGLFAATPALADSTATCATPALSQPFLAYGDTHDYTLTAGQSADGFNGAGWTLERGATIITTELSDGTVGHALSLPSGAVAISPQVCVNSTYPTARTMFRSVGAPAGVSFDVRYGSQPWFAPAGELAAQPGAWAPSDAFSLQTADLTGWTLGRYEFTGDRAGGTAELYDFYLDPYSKSIKSNATD